MPTILPSSMLNKNYIKTKCIIIAQKELASIEEFTQFILYNVMEGKINKMLWKHMRKQFSILRKA